MSSKANNGQARPTGQIRPIMVKPSITQARIKVSWISKWPSYGAYLASDSIIFKTMFPSPKWILGLLFTTVVKKAAAYVMYFNKITNQITILTRLSHTKCYSLMNMRQLQILFNWAKTWHRIVCWFRWISLFLPVLAWCDHKIVLFWSAEQFYDHIVQELVKTGKFS